MNTDLSELSRVAPLAEDAEFRRRFRDVKAANTHRLAEHIRSQEGVCVDPALMYDVQIKRIHEYKR